MTRFKNLFIAAIIGLVGAGAAQAEDGICVGDIILFDDALNSLGVVDEFASALPARNAVRHCALAKRAATVAAQKACKQNEDARFVGIIRRIDGIDLVDSRDSKVQLRKSPERDTAEIRMKSCEYYLALDF